MVALWNSMPFLISAGTGYAHVAMTPVAFTENGETRLETGFSDDVAQSLSDRGHTIVRPDLPIGGGQAIAIDRANGTLIGGSDPRKDGCAIGY